MKPGLNALPPDRLSWILDWLYPSRCRACGSRIAGKDSEFFCASCWLRIRLIGHPQCVICGRPFLDASGDDHECGSCLMRPPGFLRARAWACYPREEIDPAPLRQVVQKFKYGRKISLGKPLGRLMSLGCADFLSACRANVIIPVPLHPRRLRWRGFNQSLVLARQASRLSGIPLDPFTLYRVKETPPQTQLTEEERRKNVRDAFTLRGKESLKAKSVLLIDDVYTSGATVGECSRVLIRGGAREVRVLTLARAV